MARQYDPMRNEKDYKMYRELMGGGKEEEAYALLKKNPGLLEHLTLYDISFDCLEIRRKVGERTERYFLGRVIRTFGNVMDDIAREKRLDESYRDKRLEDFLRGLSGRAKRMLNEMGEEDEE
jgi:hypothetical protein